MTLLTPWGAARAQDSALLRFSPAVLNLGVGVSAPVEVVVEGVPASGLAAFQLDLLFDSAVASVANPNEAFRSGSPPAPIPPFAPLGDDPATCETVRGISPCPDPPWLLTATGRSPLGTDTLDDGSGRVQFAYATSGTPAPPSGSGTIGLIRVQGGTDGRATLVRITRPLLADRAEPPAPHALVSDPLIVIVGSGGPDGDTDGIPDEVDNCLRGANGTTQPDAGDGVQRDVDRDGFGNLCDGDFNQDLFVGGPDFTIFLGCFNRSVGGDAGPPDDPSCAESDMNGDGFVGGPDFTLFLRVFNGPPGPSGRVP